MNRKGLLVLLLLAFLVNAAALGQTAKILYISPDTQTGPKYDKIRSEIINGLRGCLQEKWSRDLSATTWERAPSKKKLLESLRVNYALKMNPLPNIKGTEKSIELTFELIYVDNAYQPHDITWLNNLFVLDLNASQEPTNIKDVVTSVCDEIEFFINSSSDPWQRKFRPRIKIGMPELASGQIEPIDINEFARWLNKILDDQYAENPRYLFYYNRKYNKQFPESSVYMITGKITGYQKVDDHLVNVELMIEFPNAHDVKPTVIDSEKYPTDEKTKEELLANITTVLESTINYYGK